MIYTVVEKRLSSTKIKELLTIRIFAVRSLKSKFMARRQNIGWKITSSAIKSKQIDNI